MTSRKRIPSKTANYAGLIEENSFYVDKTHFITKLESLTDKYLFFLRPRRFGKSLHLSMLEYYYGHQYASKFDRLFGEYFIGKPGNTTKSRNSYNILRFDFSGIATNEKEPVKASFNAKLSKGFKEFHDNYTGFDRPILDSLEREKEPADYLLYILSEVRSNLQDCKIYLLIDEYDHFTNELFAFNTNHFHEIVARNGWVRKFYEVIKQFMASGLIDRFFATGVTPVTLDSMTSGFNVARNITLDEGFNEMAGFTEEEMRQLILNTIHDEGKFDIENLISDMRDWYNGSKFSPDASTRVYNPQMAVSFLSQFANNFKYPREMVDTNVTSDYKKISHILSPLDPDQKTAILDEVLVKEKITEGLTLQYNFEKPFTKTDAVSLLFYNGLLTIESAFSDIITYSVPNYVVKQLYWEVFRVAQEKESNISYDISEIGYALKEMSLEGEIQHLVKYAQKIMTAISYRDLQNFSEKHLKMIFMTIFGGNSLYFVRSELETSKGYANIYLRKTAQNPGIFNHLLELKYVKQYDKVNLNKIKEEGISQVKKYCDSLPAEERVNLKTRLVIFHDKFEYQVVEISDE